MDTYTNDYMTDEIRNALREGRPIQVEARHVISMVSYLNQLGARLAEAQASGNRGDRKAQAEFLMTCPIYTLATFVLQSLIFPNAPVPENLPDALRDMIDGSKCICDDPECPEKRPVSTMAEVTLRVADSQLTAMLEVLYSAIDGRRPSGRDGGGSFGRYM